MGPGKSVHYKGVFTNQGCSLWEVSLYLYYAAIADSIFADFVYVVFKYLLNTKPLRTILLQFFWGRNVFWNRWTRLMYDNSILIFCSLPGLKQISAARLLLLLLS